MNVFISWSKPLSNQIAIHLADWLKVFDRSIHPFVSSESIEAGELWLSRLMGELNETKLAIVCITPENFTSPWINFEAGAISKSIGEKSNVIPILFGMDTSDLPRNNPFINFQGFSFNKENMLKVLRTINEKSNSPRSDNEIEKAFAYSWAGLEKELRPLIEEANGQYKPFIENSLVSSAASATQKYYDFLRFSLPAVKSAIDTQFTFESDAERMSTIQNVVREFVKSTSLEFLGTDIPGLLYEESINLNGYAFLCKFCGDNIEVVKGGCKICGIDCHIWVDKPNK
ncbi:MAG: toll/interleukin-1 receptor domain-containing protein [Bacteroidota bacterium]